MRFDGEEGAAVGRGPATRPGTPGWRPSTGRRMATRPVSSRVPCPAYSPGSSYPFGGLGRSPNPRERSDRPRWSEAPPEPEATRSVDLRRGHRGGAPGGLYCERRSLFAIEKPCLLFPLLVGVSAFIKGQTRAFFVPLLGFPPETPSWYGWQAWAAYPGTTGWAAPWQHVRG